MSKLNWQVPKPNGVVSSRDLARNTARILDSLKTFEQSLLVVRNGLPTAVIASIPDPAWRPRGPDDVGRHQRLDTDCSSWDIDENETGSTEGEVLEEAMGVLEGLDLEDSHRRVLEVLADGGQWAPDAIASAASLKGIAGLLGFLELRRLIVRRFHYYLIGKRGMEVLQALRFLDADKAEPAS
jgi:hypothetical protein